MKLFEILNKFTVVFVSAAIALQSPQATQGDDNPQQQEEKGCRQTNSSLIDFLSKDPNGKCEDKQQQEPKKCPSIPLSIRNPHKDISTNQLCEIASTCPESLLPTLSSLWVQTYSSEIEMRHLERTLLRITENGTLGRAIKGFNDGLKERERSNGPLPSEVKGEILELVLLPIVESKWKGGHSPKGAHGLYQFTRQTAKMYGLIQYKYNNGKLVGITDNRHKTYESAKAAAQLFYDLYSRFGDLNLALSAYNSGVPFKYLKYAPKSEETPYLNYLRFIADAGCIKPFRSEGNLRENLNYPSKVWAALSVINSNYPVILEYVKKPSEDNKVRALEALLSNKSKEKLATNKYFSGSRRPPFKKVLAIQ